MELKENGRTGELRKKARLQATLRLILGTCLLRQYTRYLGD